jgi:hypothetical protein
VGITRRFAIALLCLVARLVQLVIVAIALVLFLPAALVMLGIALVMLAFMAVEVVCGRSSRSRACAGPSWSARSGATG